MPAYAVATVTISDPERFAAYGAAIQGLAEEFGGESIVKGVVTEVLEGDGDPQERIVVTRFPTRTAPAPISARTATRTAAPCATAPRMRASDC